MAHCPLRRLALAACLGSGCGSPDADGDDAASTSGTADDGAPPTTGTTGPDDTTPSGSSSGSTSAAASEGPDTGESSDEGLLDSSSSGGPEGDPACDVIDPFPSPLDGADALQDEQGLLEFVARDGNSLVVFTHRSSTFDEATGPIVFIMHGAGRNAEGYLDAWREFIEDNGALALAPEFPEAFYPDSESFTFGVGTDDTPEGSTYDPEEWRAPEDYTLSEVEHLFEAVRIELANESCRYFIYGHSAGGQFVHRLLTFRTDARVQRAIAANPGWYTLPAARDDGDTFHMPYGLVGAPVDRTRQELLFAHDLVILLGEDDVLRDEDLRKTEQADAQGLNRFERGHFYFAIAQEEAESAALPLNWTLDTVPDVGHSNGGMTPAAAELLFAK